MKVYDWVSREYGHEAPMPEVWVVNHDHMQRAATQANHNTTLVGCVYGWYSQMFGKVFVSDKLVRNGKQLAAVIAHEFTHYFQHITGRPNDVAALEYEADAYMMKYVVGC